jgi:hypothetical protein
LIITGDQCGEVHFVLSFFHYPVEHILYILSEVEMIELAALHK